MINSKIIEEMKGEREERGKISRAEDERQTQLIFKAIEKQAKENELKKAFNTITTRAKRQREREKREKKIFYLCCINIVLYSILFTVISIIIK